jgi:hypothetical protein
MQKTLLLCVAAALLALTVTPKALLATRGNPTVPPTTLVATGGDPTVPPGASLIA